MANAAIRLLQKRQLKQEAKDAVRQLFHDYEGGCQVEGQPIPDEFFKDMKESACYHTDKPIAERCEFCQAAKPLWDVKKKTASQANNALRTVLAIASRLSKAQS